MMRLSVRVVPNASRTEVVVWHEGALKVKVQAPPEGGRANKALVDCLAKALGVSRREVTIVSGEKARRKVLEISGLTEGEVREKLEG